MFAGTADGDVEEAVLFIEAAFLDAAPTGELAFYGFHYKDGIEFEALGLMYGEDADAVFVAELAFEVEAEGGYFEGLVERCEAGHDVS